MIFALHEDFLEHILFVSSNDHYLPSLFSLSHPLDEVKPIISRHHGEWFYSSDKHAYTSAGLAMDEHLLLRFDEIDRVHSLWLLRKCTDEVKFSSIFSLVNLRLKRIGIKQRI